MKLELSKQNEHLSEDTKRFQDKSKSGQDRDQLKGRRNHASPALCSLSKIDRRNYRRFSQQLQLQNNASQGLRVSA